MYKVIKSLKTTRAIYSDQLVKEGVVAQEEGRPGWLQEGCGRRCPW